MNTLSAVVIGGAGGGLVTVLIHVIIVALIIGLVLWVLTQIPIPEPFGNIIRVLIIVVGCIVIVLDLLSLL